MKSESRKYIDLIYGVTSNYQVSWDLPIEIRVGDYGMNNDSTGEFEVFGNIYADKIIDMTDPALCPVEEEGEDSLIVKSEGVIARDLSTNTEAAVPGAANVALKVEFEFDGRKQAAVLVMYKPRYISFPKNERIIELLNSIPDVLKGKYVISEVTTCAAFMMYLSPNRPEKCSVTFCATGPTAPGVNARGWSAYGISREGYPTAKYVPLYRLIKPRSKF
ncbi:uncharacterized protein HD556DRAFT_680877 [Suillus plorans]|uniref:Uncharacterized protein n=1 Tax=Suillus plorans TaxID=116603 RepID=A0A9P7DFS8_9AGAM|nr:uncharacterized protein HD556DRAFT_680877 [Suillus plorans]KAG1790830.1 hypothetical protein HD556DRAFT_680877 [Suillus plorans]